jgi:hypothetical protein
MSVHVFEPVYGANEVNRFLMVPKLCGDLCTTRYTGAGDIYNEYVRTMRRAKLFHDELIGLTPVPLFVAMK